MRHWTDTNQIGAFAFCVVMSLVLIQVMELEAGKAGWVSISNGRILKGIKLGDRLV